MKTYLEELRGNRDLKVRTILRSSLVSGGLGDPDLGLLQRVTLLQNQTRGPLFEWMAEVIVGSVTALEGCERQRVFPTPFGDRRVDLFSHKDLLAIEVKSGYVRSCEATRIQLKKDQYLLAHRPEVRRMVWLCFRGASEPFRKLLAAAEVEYCDLEYDSLEKQISEARKTVFRAE